jgi:hypothetical protein
MPSTSVRKGSAMKGLSVLGLILAFGLSPLAVNNSLAQKSDKPATANNPGPKPDKPATANNPGSKPDAPATVPRAACNPKFQSCPQP